MNSLKTIARNFTKILANFKNRLILLSILTGIISGFGAIFFRTLIIFFHKIFFEHIGTILMVNTKPFLFPLIPALGGFIVGIIIYWGAKEARGHSVPEVMEAILIKEGKIKLKVAITKIFASAICIGSGGSAGRVGPIVQIGSTFGSFIGQKFIKENSNFIKILLSAGAAGGISATFNAPIAGIFFSLELFLAEFKPKIFGPIIISSVTASFISHSFIGNIPAFAIPAYTLSSFYEFFTVVILGICAGIIGVIFIILLYKMEDIFDLLKIPQYIKPAIGGILIGIIGIFYSNILGVGYTTIENALEEQYNIKLLLIFLIAKLFATPLTIGSGGSGGVFAPSLFLGAMLGTLIGQLNSMVFNFNTHPGAYGIIGMGALVAATTHAPFTSILIIFEMTRNYNLILPLMLASLISFITASSLKEDSIYTLKLTRRGIHLRI